MSRPTGSTVGVYQHSAVRWLVLENNKLGVSKAEFELTQLQFCKPGAVHTLLYSRLQKVTIRL